MRRIIIVLASYSYFLLCPQMADTVEFFVRPEGDDQATGTLSQPFATLERARDAVRKARLNGIVEKDVTVWIGGGRYFISTELFLNSNDSGTKASPVIYKALPGEMPRFIGGSAIDPTGFSKVTSNSPIWHRLDPSARGNILECNLVDLDITKFGDLTSGHHNPIHSELSFNGEIMQLGRWPNEDFTVIYEALSETTFVYDHDRPNRWAEASAPWVNGYWRHLWANKYLPVTKIDTNSNVLTISDRPGYPISTGRFWYGLNLLEEIDRPGEWYLERKRDATNIQYGTLYFWPPNDISSAEILLSLHGANGSAFVRLDSVSHVRFEELSFELTRADGFIINNSRNVLINRCNLRNIGRHGVVIENCVRVGVLNSELSAIGSEGVRLSGGDRQTLTPGRNFVRNSHIHNFSRWKRTYSQAIRFHKGAGNEATHNLIHGTPHIAIQYSGNNHLIRYNEIYNSCWETGDAGVIMGDWGWDSRGNRIIDNYLHDNVSRYGGRGEFNAVYLDGSCAGDTIAGNVFYNSGAFGVMHNSGREVVIENNIFVGSRSGIHATAKAWYDTTEGHAMNFLERIQAFDFRNPPWSTAYPALARTPDNHHHPDFERFKYPIGSVLVRNIGWHNRYWLDPRNLEAFEYYELISDNIAEQDPRFFNESERQLALRNDSPAWKLPGFRRIAFEKMGRLERTKATRPQPPNGYRHPLSNHSGSETPSIRLRWAPSINGHTRDLYLSNKRTNLDNRLIAARITTEDYELTQLQPATTYFWRVDERDANDEILALGDIWDFTTNELSDDPRTITYRFDTTELKAIIDGTAVSGRIEDNTAVFQFETFRLSPETKMIVDGNRPLEVVSLKDIDISGSIDMSGANGGDSYLGTAKGGRGRLGGFDGGNAGETDSTGSAGAGPGAGGKSTIIFFAGGGGGFGGSGGDATIELEQTVKSGYDTPSSAIARGGKPYGTALDRNRLHGGSGGAGGGGGTTSGASGPGGAGGGGGGAIRLTAARDIIIHGTIMANGGNGTGFRRTGGGGSGGMIALHAGGVVKLASTARISANGGRGGDCAWMGANGGGGGGGRILIAGERLMVGQSDLPPGTLSASSQFSASGGRGGYYAVDAINNAAKGTDGTLFFKKPD